MVSRSSAGSLNLGLLFIQCNKELKLERCPTNISIPVQSSNTRKKNDRKLKKMARKKVNLIFKKIYEQYNLNLSINMRLGIFIIYNFFSSFFYPQYNVIKTSTWFSYDEESKKKKKKSDNKYSWTKRNDPSILFEAIKADDAHSKIDHTKIKIQLESVK